MKSFKKFEILTLYEKVRNIYYLLSWLLSVTAIHTKKYRVSSDPRSQLRDGIVSTTMGDRVGILCAVIFIIINVI